MSAARLTDAIRRAHARGRAALVGYLCAGDPDPTRSAVLLDALAGEVDVLEIGVPFSDPMADGPVIQRASERALGAGTRLDDVFELVRGVRARHPGLGIVLMGYLNNAYARGYAAFMRAAAEAGADGVLLVDAPPEEADAPRAAARAEGLAWVPLLAPTSDTGRIAQATAIADGFVYYVSLKGVTGADMRDLDETEAKIAAIRQATTLPVCVGFGVKTPQQAARLARVADGVVVGSRFVAEIERDPEQAPQRIAEAARAIAGALGRG